jgi:glycosyltransferase involved in cell wall biosynthesis
MKILYLITRAERGGAQVHVLDLIRGLHRHCEIEVAAGEDGFLLQEARSLGVVGHVLPHLVHPVSPANDIRALREIVGLLRRTRPDVVHAHTSKAGILGRLAAWFCKVPALFTAHTWSFAEGTSWKWKLLGAPSERFAALLGGTIINVSEANRSLALAYSVVPSARMVTIHNGIPDEAREASASAAAPPIILMVARFAPQKNQGMLLNACARINAPFRLQFAGTGPTLSEIESMVSRLGLQNRVEFLGDCSDIADRLRQASIFALATNWEGFPLSILEAMRAGLPIVASDVGGVREAVIEGQTGFLISRQDTAAFAGALERLLTDPSLRARMARNGRQRFEQYFTVDQMLRKTFSLYCRAVSSPLGEFDAPGVGERI